MAERPDEPRHPIQVAARRSGLSPALLRAWERRYAAVTPRRDTGQQRLYSDADIARLRRLRMVTEAGRRIGDVAQLDDHSLGLLLREDAREEMRPTPPGAPGRPPPEQTVEEALRRVRRGDARGLRRLLDRMVILHEPMVVLDDIVADLMDRIGQCWAEGSLRATQEHLASQVVRPLLDDLHRRLQPEVPLGLAVVGVLSGEVHELGALGASVAFGSCGWQAVNLGSALPARSIAHVALERRADLVAISITSTDSSGEAAKDLEELRSHLGDTPVLVGGYSADSVRRTLNSIAAIQVRKAQQIPDVLRDLLRGDRPPAAARQARSGRVD